MKDKKVLIKVDSLVKRFPINKSLDFFGGKKYLTAVDGVTVDIYEGETLGLVGESGCGKSTFGRTILNLYEKTSGDVLYNDISLSSLKSEEMRGLRRELQIVFQDPYSSLNPKLTVGQMIAEGLIAHGIYKKMNKELESYILEVMESCGLQPYMLHRYPHEFSGGQRQRICIARALALKPRFVVCDECVSTLDVSIQSQIINLLLDLKEKNNLTYLFISHDLSVVRFISDRIAVMYLGEMVEIAKTDNLFETPLHPYTRVLIDAIPDVDVKKEIKAPIIGDVQSILEDFVGCKFYYRCSFAKDICKTVKPKLSKIENEHFVACHNLISSRGD